MCLLHLVTDHFRSSWKLLSPAGRRWEGFQPLRLLWPEPVLFVKQQRITSSIIVPFFFFSWLKNLGCCSPHRCLLWSKSPAQAPSIAGHGHELVLDKEMQHLLSLTCDSEQRLFMDFFFCPMTFSPGFHFRALLLIAFSIFISASSFHFVVQWRRPGDTVRGAWRVQCLPL